LYLRNGEPNLTLPKILEGLRMKKAFVLLLVCLIAGGCGKQSEEPETVKTEKETEAAEVLVDNKDAETVSEAVTEKETKVEEMDSDIPEHVKQIYLGYKEVQETCDVQYLVYDLTPQKSKYGSYVFYLMDKDNPKEDIMLFFEECDGEIEKSYRAIFALDEGEYLKDAIIATFMITGELNYSEAREQMQKLFQSYPVDDYSDILDSGDYKVLLTPDNGTGIKLEIRHKDEIFRKIDKDQCSDISYDMFQNPDKNAGTLVSLTGTVLEHDREKNIILRDRLRVLGEDGNEYIIAYFLDSCPVIFEIGRQYTFYGKLINPETWNVSISLYQWE